MQPTTFPDNPLLAVCRQYFDAGLAPQSRIGYGYDWAMFERWCCEHQRAAIPPSAEAVAFFLVDQLTRLKVSTARRRFSAIARHYKDHGFTEWNQSGAIRLLRGAQRLRLERPRQMRPITIAQLREMSAALERDGSPLAVRNRAVLLVGFASALRSVNLAGLTLDDVEFVKAGLVLSIGREKQDQEGRGRLVGIPHGKHAGTCAVQALRDWLAIRKEASTRRIFLGFYFNRNRQTAIPTSAKGICKIVKACIRRIGVDPAPYGAHSLRAGFITEAAEAGLSDLLIASHTGHRDVDMIRLYFRRTSVFRANACAALDL